MSLYLPFSQVTTKGKSSTKFNESVIEILIYSASGRIFSISNPEVYEEKGLYYYRKKCHLTLLRITC